MGKTIRLNFSTRQNSHCHDVELVEFTECSLLVRAQRDIPLDAGRILLAGRKAWLPRRPMSAQPPDEEVLTRHSSVVMCQESEAWT